MLLLFDLSCLCKDTAFFMIFNYLILGKVCIFLRKETKNATNLKK